MQLVHVQILRGMAALAVATQHALHDAGHLSGASEEWLPVAEHLPWNAGVDVFFVVSGLIMVHSSERLFARPGAWAVFLKRRIARIVPLYWLASTLYLAVAFAAPGLLNREFLGPGYVLASFVFVPLVRPDGLVQPLYPLGWTLNYEMFFYALFAVALALPRRSAGLLVIVLLAGLVVAGRALASLPQPLAFWTDPMVLEFAAGVAIGLLRRQALRPAPSARWALAVAGLLALGLTAAFPEVAGRLPRALAYGGPAVLLVAAAALGPEGGARRALARIAVSLGDASYALYLVHPFVIRAFREALARTGLAGGTGPLLFVVLVLAAAAVAAVLVFILVERPLTGRVRRWLGVAERREAEPAPLTRRGPAS